MFEDGERPACLLVEDGRIAEVLPYEAHFPSFDPAHAIDARDLVVLPGLVDSHVHANEPGRTEWEGLETATRAAAAGGVTTLVDMPLNSLPPTTTRRGARLKRRPPRARSPSTSAFWGGAVPGNARALAPLRDAGVCGFKAFLVDSGVPEFPPLDTAGLALALETCAGLGAPLLVHAELSGPMPRAEVGRSYASCLASRPQAAEVEAISLVVDLMRGTGARVHIVHLSAARRRAGRRARAGGRVRTLRRDLPALPRASPPRTSPTARRSSSARRRSARRRTASACGPRSRGHHRPGRVATTRRARPAVKALDSGDFGEAWGGDRVARARAAGGVDRGSRQRGPRRRRRALDERAPARWPA